MGMMASLAAGANPHIVTRASWLFITTNSIKEAFVRQGALQQGIYIYIYRAVEELFFRYIYIAWQQLGIFVPLLHLGCSW